MANSSMTRFYEEEIRHLVRERDKFRDLAADAETENVKQRFAYMELANKYEREKEKRIVVERLLTVQASTSSDVEVRSIPGSTRSHEKVQGDICSDGTTGAPPVAAAHNLPLGEQLEEGEGVVGAIVNRLGEAPMNIESMIGTPNHNETEVVSNRIRNDTTENLSHQIVHPPGIIPVTPTQAQPHVVEERQPSVRLPSLPILTPSPTPNPSEDFEDGDEKAVKKEAFKISKAQKSKYLSDAKLFHISQPLEVRVSRAALTGIFGLPGMGMLWRSKDLKHRFLTPTFDLNPDLPRRAGEPGLLLSCRKDMCDGSPWTLFIKANTKKNVRLNYAGEYVCKTVGELTAEEFSSQDFAVKINWGKKIATHKRYPVYRLLRARITLRKRLDCEPEEEEVNAEADAIGKKDYKSSLTHLDVVEAFERGEERINIVKTECVSYSHERAAEYAEAQVEFEGRPKDPSTKKRKQTTEAKSALPKKKKRVEMDSDSGGDVHQNSVDPPLSSPVASSSTPARSQRQRTKSYKLMAQE